MSHLFEVKLFDHNGDFHHKDEVSIDDLDIASTEIASQYGDWLEEGGYIEFSCGSQNYEPCLILPAEDKVGYLEGQLFKLRNELRIRFTGLAMQGMLSAETENFNQGRHDLAKSAVMQADALLAELEKSES